MAKPKVNNKRAIVEDSDDLEDPDAENEKMSSEEPAAESSAEPEEREDSEKKRLIDRKRKLVQQLAAKEPSQEPEDYAPAPKRKCGRPPKAAQQVQSKLRLEQDAQMQLQIELDIEEESKAKDQRDIEALAIARSKHPRIFELLDERNESLKFKSMQWQKAQAKNKAEKKVIMFKNLKQILTNFDGAAESINYNQGSYMSIEAGFSVRVRAKFCDFTGFRHKYQH